LENLPSLELQPADLAALFPALIVTDGALVIRHVGPSIARLVPEALGGDSLWSVFTLERPIDPDALTAPGGARTRVILRRKAGGVLLRGLAVRIALQIVFFVGHAPTTLLEGNSAGLSFDDFSAADASLDALMAVEVQRATAAELKQLIEELTQARERAESADRAKSEFLANVSHEVRTPLTAILGFAELLSRRSLPGPTATSYVDRIVDGARSLLAIVNQILDWSKLEADHAEVENRSCDPAQLARDCLLLARGQVGGKPVQLHLDVDAKLPRALWVDDQKLRQILMNLLSNAVKFTDFGDITLKIGFHQPPGDLVVSVSDTGCGISPEAVGRLFQRFSQADGSSRRAHGGTGLGLAITKGLVEKMGGQITVVSQPGLGSAFSVRIPCRRTDPGAVEGAPDAAVQTPPRPADPEATHILLADDNDANRQLITAFLTELGYGVEAVTDGQAAVVAADARPFDVILMDIQMPVLDGFAAAAQIRKGQGPNSRTPIIAVSANAGSRREAEQLGSGMDDYVAKPLNFVELAEKVAHWAGQGTAEVSPPTVTAVATSESSGP